MKYRSVSGIARWLLFCFALPLVVLAQRSPWESIGPHGGSIASLVRSPKSVDVMYALLEGESRLLVSENRGATWSERAMREGRASKLLTNPSKPGSVYTLVASYNPRFPSLAGGGKSEPSRLAESTDGGRTWSAKSFPPIYAVLGVAFDAGDPKTVHAVARASATGIPVYLRSSDGGETWNVTEIPGQRISAAILAIDPLDGRNVYVSVQPELFTLNAKVLFQSTDGGRSFSPLSFAKGELSFINEVSVDAVVAGRVFVLTYSGLYRSLDDGGTWQKINKTKLSPQRMWTDTRNPDHLIVAVGEGVAESRDGGVSWSGGAAKVPGDRITALLVDPRSEGEIIIANSAGIFASMDHGVTWKSRNRGILATEVTSLRIDPSAPNVLYAGVMSNAMYRTVGAINKDVVWNQLPLFYTCTSIGDIQLMLKKPYRVLALEGGG